MQDPVELIKNRLDIVDVVAPYVELKKAGRNYKGLCPFHKEKTPSFMVSQEKQLAYCFSCRKGGDMFSFIQEIEGMEFGESLRLLAERAQVPLTQEQSPVKKGKKQRLLALMREVEVFFRKGLKEAWGEVGETYWQQRGLQAEAMEEFGLGVAPPKGKLLTEYLLKQGYTKEEMVAAGVVVGKDVGALQVYDRFVDRVMFTLHNEQGAPIGFAGRVLGDGEPKYLNTPETILYHKGQVLYGWHWAKKAIREEDKVIVVEGYMDVIACHRAGYLHVVGVSGTALTEEHMHLINRLTKNILFCFDEDGAGWQATERSFEVAASHDVNILTISLPGGKDPDEVLAHDPEGFAKSMAEAQPFMERYLEHCSARYDYRTPLGQKQLSHALFQKIAHLHSPIEQEWYMKRLAELLGVHLPTVYHSYQTYRSGIRQPRKAALPEKTSQSTALSKEEWLLGMCIFDSGILTPARPYLEEEILWLEEKTKALYKVLRSQYTDARFPLEDMSGETIRQVKEYGLILRLYMEEHFGHTTEEERIALFLKVATSHRHQRYTYQQKELQDALRRAERQGDHATQASLLQQLNDLLPRLRS